MEGGGRGLDRRPMDVRFFFGGEGLLFYVERPRFYVEGNTCLVLGCLFVCLFVFCSEMENAARLSRRYQERAVRRWFV